MPTLAFFYAPFCRHDGENSMRDEGEEVCHADGAENGMAPRARERSAQTLCWRAARSMLSAVDATTARRLLDDVDYVFACF